MEEQACGNCFHVRVCAIASANERVVHGYTLTDGHPKHFPLDEKERYGIPWNILAQNCKFYASDWEVKTALESNRPAPTGQEDR